MDFVSELGSILIFTGCFLGLPYIIWARLLRWFKTEKIHPISKSLILSVCGLEILFVVSLAIQSVAGLNYVQDYIQSLCIVWLFFTYSQINKHLTLKYLRKQSLPVIILLQLITLCIGILMIFSSNGGYAEQFSIQILIGILLTSRSSWIMFAIIVDRISTRTDFDYKTVLVNKNTVLSIDLKLGYFSKVLNRITYPFSKPHWKDLFWLVLCVTTGIELWLTFTYGGPVIQIFFENYSYLAILVCFMIVSIGINIIHEWGHILGARMYGGVGVYKIKLKRFYSFDAVDIQTSFFTSPERIKISVMGILWTNFIAFIPSLILIYLYLYQTAYLSSLFSLIIAAVVMGAILNTCYFIFSVWTGGDLNNFLRNFKRFLKHQDDTSETVSKTETTAYSLKNENFHLEEGAKYCIQKSIELKSVKDKVHYLIDKENYSTFTLNNSAKNITQILVNSTNWTIPEVVTALQTTYEFPDNKIPLVTQDVTKFVLSLGQWGFISKVQGPAGSNKMDIKEKPEKAVVTGFCQRYQDPKSISLSHHPNCAKFTNHSLKMGRYRLCIGCFVGYPIAVLGLIAAIFLFIDLSVTPIYLMSYGIIFYTSIFLSFTKFTDKIPGKIFQKICIGFGSGSFLVGSFLLFDTWVVFRISFALFLFFCLRLPPSRVHARKTEKTCKSCELKGTDPLCIAKDKEQTKLYI